MVRAAIVVAIFMSFAHTASAAEGGGIKGCIDSAIVDGKLHLSHVIEGAGDVISRDEWVIRCEGPAAMAAWDQFYALRHDDPSAVVNPNGAHALFMQTGKASRCMKLTQNPDGSPAAKVVCEISIDLTPGFYQGALGQ